MLNTISPHQQKGGGSGVEENTVFDTWIRYKWLDSPNNLDDPGVRGHFEPSTHDPTTIKDGKTLAGIYTNEW